MSQSQEPEPTRLESADEILKALEARKARPAQTTTGKVPPLPQGKLPPPELPDTVRERPLQRPSMALLCILDDGKQDGEWVRLRADSTVIGRNDGTICIPHDVQMSGRHAEIIREATPRGWRWSLRDLNSTNGVYVRVGSTILRNDNEFRLGQGHYRFESAGTIAEQPAAAPSMQYATTAFPMPSPVKSRTLVPSLIEIQSGTPVQRFSLVNSEYWIGRDPTGAAIGRPDDPFVDPLHARLYRDKSGQWHIANNESINGLWLRVKHIILDKACQFRLGEQRFLFRVC